MEPSKPWYSLITIDLLFLLLDRSIFNSFIAWLIPLCLRAVATPSSSPKFQFACLYATLVTAFHLLQSLSQRIAYGSPRKIDWENEVVVITGGASGLGRVLASMFGMKGVAVAVLDVRVPEEQEIRGDESLAEVRFYECDVGDRSAVEETKKMIERDLGTPTILINNAAVAHGRNFLDLSSSQIETSLKVNVLAHFNTIGAFLPGMLSHISSPHDTDNTDTDNKPTGGTIVTISSVLGKLGAAQLTDYTATKAAVIALHKSLEAELALSDSTSVINMILVTPGQLSTPMFASISSPSTFFGPVVEPVHLARAIVQQIERGASGEIALPLYARYIEIVAILPVGVQRMVRWLSGVDLAMKGYKAVEEVRRGRKTE